MQLVNFSRLVGSARNKYIIAGCTNTLCSYVLFLALLHTFSFYLSSKNSFRLAVFSSFWISLAIGFTLQRFFVWRGIPSQIKSSIRQSYPLLKRSTRRQFGLFTAYNTLIVLANIYAVEIMKRTILIDVRFGQVVFTAVYALCGYFFGRWLFRK